MTFWYWSRSIDTIFWWFMNLIGCWKTYKVSDFKVKIASQKWQQTSPKLIVALDNMKKMSKKY